jgi:hypothetical protein
MTKAGNTERRLIAIFVADVEGNKTTSWECRLHFRDVPIATDPNKP